VRKIASIILLGILLFNWIGFRFFSSYMEQKANQQLETQLDDNKYDQAELISIKIPANHVSSYANSSQFERVDGQVEVNGIKYKYVKIRHFNDSLELLCIPNQLAMKLQNAKEDFFKLVNDLQHTGQNKKGDGHPGASKNFSVDYYLAIDLYSAESLSISLSPKSFYYNTDIPTIYSLTAEQPPEYC
jgi:hypothetical protein